MPAGTKKAILLVEDEIIIALAEAYSLRRAGYEVIETRTGEEAVRRATEEPRIDLVLMDIGLGPGIDGIEAARRILLARDLPIIFLTSYPRERIEERLDGMRSYGCLGKCLEGPDLHFAIERALTIFKSEHGLLATAGVGRATASTACLAGASPDVEKAIADKIATG